LNPRCGMRRAQNAGNQVAWGKKHSNEGFFPTKKDGEQNVVTGGGGKKPQQKTEVGLGEKACYVRRRGVIRGF